MSYRDDREALHHRVAQLEEELRGARREGEEQGRDAAAGRAAALEQKLRAMRADLENMESELTALRGGKPRNRIAVLVGAAIAVVAMAGIGLGLALRSAPPPPQAAAPLPIPAPPRLPQGPARIEPLPPAPEPTVEAPKSAPRVTKAQWNATVTRADGVPLAPGASCAIVATISTDETNSGVDDLAVVCGAVKLHRSDDKLEGMSQSSNDVREVLGPSDEKSAFTIAYRDVGARSGERTQIDLDTNRRQGTVFRDAIPRFRVELSLPTNSTQTASLAGPAQRLRRAGSVSEVTGASPVKNGAKCKVRAMPTGKQKDCVAEVSCGSAILWGPTAAVACTYAGARPVSIGPKEEGAAASLLLAGATMTVRTKGFGVTIALEDEAP